jgi:hypothetical protein
VAFTQAGSRNRPAAPDSTVGYHVRLACATDPGCRLAHEAAAGTKTMVTVKGLKRMEQLVAQVQETGRYPSRKAESIFGPQALPKPA